MTVSGWKRAWKALAAALRGFRLMRGARPSPRLQASPEPTSAATPAQEPAPGSPPWLAALAREQDRQARELAELWAEVEALEREIEDLRLQFEHLRRQRKATSSNEGGAGNQAPAPRAPEVSHDGAH